jgi:hypothetical protein
MRMGVPIMSASENLHIFRILDIADRIGQYCRSRRPSATRRSNSSGKIVLTVVYFSTRNECHTKSSDIWCRSIAISQILVLHSFSKQLQLIFDPPPPSHLEVVYFAD